MSFVDAVPKPDTCVLAIEITETQDYDELVKLVNEYNKLKNEN